jgi:hypothetical protein
MPAHLFETVMNVPGDRGAPVAIGPSPGHAGSPGPGPGGRLPWRGGIAALPVFPDM